MNAVSKAATANDSFFRTFFWQKSFSFYRNNTFASLLIGYTGYYLCRQNISVAYAPMHASLGLSLEQFGWITSLGTLAYAIGKVAFGGLADTKRGGKQVFFIGMLGSVAASLLFGLSTGVTVFIALWALNRLFQSMGWSGVVNVMSHWYPKQTYGTMMGLMSISYQFGGVLASLYAGFLLSIGLPWQSVFFIPAVTLLLIALISFPFLVSKPQDVGFDGVKENTVPTTVQAPQPVTTEPLLSYTQRFRILLRDPMFVTMLGLSFLLTLLRECFSLWMPIYFSQMGATASTAAFKSAIFPLLGCVGTLFAGWFSDKYLQGRRGPMLFGLMAGLVLALVALSKVDLVSHFASTHWSAWFTVQNTAAVLVGVVGFFLLGPYSLVGGVVALDFGGKKTAGTAAGLLDGAGYLGASLAGIGVAKLMANTSWNHVYVIMAALTAIGMVLCLVLWTVKPRNR